MNTEEHKEFREAFKRYAKKVGSSKKESQNFLKRAGIHNKNGKLSTSYTSVSK